MKSKIEVGQVWFKPDNKFPNLYKITRLTTDNAYYRNDSGIEQVFTYVDGFGFSKSFIRNSGWHFKWADDIKCECEIARKDCMSHS